MRWRAKEPPKNRDQRAVERYLFLPKTLRVELSDGKKVLETRWLETAFIIQQYDLDYASPEGRWFNLKWQ